MEDIDGLIKDREAFDAYVYTPLDAALDEIKKRANDSILAEKVRQVVPDLPREIIEGSIKAVLFRQIATPNYEIRRFLNIATSIEECTPLFGEHREDRMFTGNDYKKSWGKLMFFSGPNKKNPSVRIIDFRNQDTKKLCDINTLWGQSLVEFHHELFEKTFMSLLPQSYFNISPWLNTHGAVAKKYYKPILFWFLQHAILFENFTLGEESERAFTRDIFLPAFKSVMNDTGYKPLIVNLLPTDIESTEFWLGHPEESREYVESKFPKNLSDKIKEA